MDDATGHIRQAKIPPGVAVGQAFMVETEQVQDGRVIIVNMHSSKSEMPRPAAQTSSSAFVASPNFGSRTFILSIIER